jgi:DNA-directed RNA polymerase specialized sigma24 family protein
MRGCGWKRSQDRALLEMALSRQLTRRKIAGLLGIEAGTVSRRVQRLVTRLGDPLVVALLERPGRLPDEFRQLGIEYFVQKRSIEDLADLHRVSRAQVLKMIHYVRGWAIS